MGSLIWTSIRRPQFWPAVGLVAVLAATLVPAAHASRGWVGRDYYGINFQQLRELPPAERSKHLARITKLGIRDMRVGFAWPRIEPLPPVNGHHQYKWDALDSEIRALARHRIRAQANITQTPRWDADTSIIGALNCNRSSSWAPLDISPYGPLVKAVANRFGRGGTFWKANPGLPAEPITRYEIWNEPNLRGGWCPNPQPSRYADMFVIAANAIHSVDPHAEVVTGGVAPPAKPNKHYLGISDFMGQVTARQPGLVRKAAGSAVHIYPATGPAKQLDRLVWFRDQLRQGGIPNKMPMLINEIGWPTHGSGETISEAKRSKAYKAAAVNIPRTNCNVMGILPQAWTSAQQDPKNPEDWYGIANPTTAKPYPSAHAYANAGKLMRGQLAQPPPDKPLMVCPGMPAPQPPGAPGKPSRCTIAGTPASDTLGGTTGRDVACGFGGQDVVKTKAARDVALGGAGADRLFGGAGADRLEGGTGRDKLLGGSGSDVLIGGPGRDVCYGKRKHDRFRSCEKVVSR